MINVEEFQQEKDIYICPDPQEHRPAWIWFAYIEHDFAVAAGRGEASSWWQSAMKSRTGQIHVAGKIYQVILESVSDNKEIDKFIHSYKTRYRNSWNPAWEANFRPTVCRVRFLEAIGNSDLT